MRPPIPEELEQIAKDVVDAAIKLHIALGPGLLESVYMHRKITHKDTKTRTKIGRFRNTNLPLLNRFSFQPHCQLNFVPLCLCARHF